MDRYFLQVRSRCLPDCYREAPVLGHPQEGSREGGQQGIDVEAVGWAGMCVERTNHGEMSQFVGAKILVSWVNLDLLRHDMKKLIGIRFVKHGVSAIL